MTKKKQLRSSEVTVYIIELLKMSNKLYTLSVKYEINEKLITTPILYYRISNRDLALMYFNKINKIIEDNLPNLCVKKLDNWLFNDHVLKFLMRSQN